jgi:prephenate dehydrogenase
MPQRICIVGLGQMGGSVAKSIKKRVPSTIIIGWARHQEEIDYALETGTIDEGYTSPEKALNTADFTVLALPVEPIIDFVKDNIHSFKKGSVVTDISSVKSIIVEQVRPLLCDIGVHFIGSHPMAGNEKSGLQNSDPDLYIKAIIFICSYPTDDPAAINIIREFWRELEAIPYEIDATAHDEIVACTSHMLHISSSVVTHIALEDSRYELAKLACAGSFRDTSRIAGSCPKMWRDITKTNKPAILKAMQKTIDELETLKQAITNDEWDTLECYLARGRELRQKWWQDYQHLKE